MRNKIKDLNNHLFAQIERLGDEELNDEQLDREIARSKAITQVADAIIESNRVTIEAMSVLQKAGVDISNMGKGSLFHQNILEGGQDDE